MKFLTTEGELVEGTPLSADEQDIYSTLMENVSAGGKNPTSHIYLTQAETKAVVTYLMANFHISPRIKPDSVSDGEKIVEVEPDAPQVPVIPSAIHDIPL